MAQIESYQDLMVWQRSMNLVVDCYAISRLLPRDEDFVLKMQIRRSAVSVPSNIREGHGRTGAAEYLHHLSIAHGSLMELETQLFVAVVSITSSSRRLTVPSAKSKTFRAC